MFHCGCHVCGVPLLNLPLLPSSPPADHRRPGEDRPVRLEDQHAPEALHEREQRGAVVLAGGGGLQRGEERAPPAVRHRLHQGALTRVQGAAGWVMDWLVLCSSTWLNRNVPPAPGSSSRLTHVFCFLSVSLADLRISYFMS